MIRYSSSLLAAALLSISAASSATNLQGIYLQALDNDPQLKADRAKYMANREAYTIGRAGLLPQINASAEKSDSDEDEIATATPLGLPTPVTSKGKSDADTTTYTVSLSQPLFNMPAWFGFRQGAAISEQAKAQFSADQQTLIIRVAEAYFNVLRDIDNLETSVAEEDALSHQLEQTKQRFEVGLTAITDVHEAQAAFDGAVANTLGSRGNLGISFEALEVLTGQPHAAVTPLQEKFPVINPEPAARSDWVDFALSNNYSLKVARFARDAARQNSRARTSAHLPSVTGSLSYRDVESDGENVFGNPFSSEKETEIVQIRVDMPLFTGGRLSGERRQAHNNYLQALELHNKAQRDTIQGARALHLNVTTDVARVKARKQAITSSTSALEATQAGYEVGTRNLVDVLVAQRTLYQARRDYANTLYDYVINMLRLKEVAGLLSPTDIEQLNQWLDHNKEITRDKYAR